MPHRNVGSTRLLNRLFALALALAALLSDHAAQLVNNRTYATGKRAQTSGPGYYVYCLCRFSSCD